MSSKGQTINDRLNAAKYIIAGKSLSRVICKATTEEMLQPKKKHLDYLAACTYESDTDMVEFANQLIERTNHSNWIVVYKALITVHHLMSFGSERFTQYLASSNYSFKPGGFHDKVLTKGYNMSTYIRRYAIYINQKSLSYRRLAVDLCRKQRTKEKVLKTMPIERLLETLPVVHKQLDTLLNFDCSPEDLSNSIIVACFRLLFHDAIRLFASYNDGIINLFEKYFDLNKKMCREAFEAYKKFLDCVDRVSDMLTVAETINLDRGDIPDFKRAPSSLLQALEQHLISLETNKRDKPIVISAKNATIPSFSAILDFEPSLSVVVKGVESTNTGLDDQTCEQGVEAIDALSNIALDNNSDNRNKPMVSSQMDPFTPPAILDSRSSQPRIAPLSNASTIDSPIGAYGQPDISAHKSMSIDSKTINDLKDVPIFGSPNKNEPHLQKKIETFGGNNINILDVKPPGFCDGSMLTPEFSIETRFDPSIDLQTQQQLIQIQREQAVLRKKQHPDITPNSYSPINLNNNNNNAITNNEFSSTTSNIYRSPYRSSPTDNMGGIKSKTKPESIFEDLEKSMRQSLQTTDK